jgi:NAD-dependent deacetylase sirtuin 5
VRILTKVDVLLVVGTSSLVSLVFNFLSGANRSLNEGISGCRLCWYGQNNAGTVAVFNMGQSQAHDDANFAFYVPYEETIPRLLEVLDNNVS